MCRASKFQRLRKNLRWVSDSSECRFALQFLTKAYVSTLGSVTARVQSRRAFVKGAAKVAVTAPAAVLLLDASAKATPIAQPYEGSDRLFGDDFADDFTLGDDALS